MKYFIENYNENHKLYNNMLIPKFYHKYVPNT